MRDCIMKRLYEQYTPYVQVLGFIILCAFTAGFNWNVVSAYGKDIDDLKKWKEQTQPALARMQQQVQDIHDYLIPIARR